MQRGRGQDGRGPSAPVRRVRAAAAAGRRGLDPRGRLRARHAQARRHLPAQPHRHAPSRPPRRRRALRRARPPQGRRVRASAAQRGQEPAGLRLSGRHHRAGARHHARDHQHAVERHLRTLPEHPLDHAARRRHHPVPALSPGRDGREAEDRCEPSGRHGRERAARALLRRRRDQRGRAAEMPDGDRRSVEGAVRQRLPVLAAPRAGAGRARHDRGLPRVRRLGHRNPPRHRARQRAAAVPAAGQGDCKASAHIAGDGGPPHPPLRASTSWERYDGTAHGYRDGNTSAVAHPPLPLPSRRNKQPTGAKPAHLQGGSHGSDANSSPDRPQPPRRSQPARRSRRKPIPPGR